MLVEKKRAPKGSVNLKQRRLAVPSVRTYPRRGAAIVFQLLPPFLLRAAGRTLDFNRQKPKPRVR